MQINANVPDCNCKNNCVVTPAEKQLAKDWKISEAQAHAAVVSWTNTMYEMARNRSESKHKTEVGNG